MKFEGSRKAAAQSKRPSSRKRKIKFLRTFIKKRFFFFLVGYYPCIATFTATSSCFTSKGVNMKIFLWRYFCDYFNTSKQSKDKTKQNQTRHPIAQTKTTGIDFLFIYFFFKKSMEPGSCWSLLSSLYTVLLAIHCSYNFPQVILAI